MKIIFTKPYEVKLFLDNSNFKTFKVTAQSIKEVITKLSDVVDDYFNRVKTGIIGIIAENPNDGEYALDLLMIAKYFERIGDHCTNIAEWVEFSVTGQHKDCQ